MILSWPQVASSFRLFVAVATPAGPVISNIAIDAGSNTATVTWTTDVPSDSTVVYGTNTTYGSMATGNSNTTHTVSLSGLITNTIYHFLVSSTSGTNTSTSTDGTFLTLGGQQNTNPIYFVSTSTSVSMLVSNSTSAAVTWYWGDGTTNTSSSHTFASPGTYTNYVIVNPPSAVIGFGAACQSSANTTLSSISGLSNYTNLQGLFAYQTGLSQLSLLGCSNLVYIALVSTSPSQADEDQWFIDLANQEGTMPSGTLSLCSDPLHYFFYPASPGPTSASAAARSHLTSIGWTLAGY